MTTENMIKQLRQKIVEAQEKGEDVSELSRQLRDARAEIAAQAEVEELKKVADQRNRWKAEAENVKTRAARQEAAIDRFLELRDDLLGKLQPFLEGMRELARRASMDREGNGEVFEEFPDAFNFGAAVSGLPRGYLPEDFTCPMLELSPGTVPAYGKALEMFSYFQASLGLLSNFRKGVMTASLKGVDDGVGMPEDLEEDSDEEEVSQDRSCIVCESPDCPAIDRALQDGRSLRDIEAEYGISRSSLSRHKNNCLNAGAVRVLD